MTRGDRRRPAVRGQETGFQDRRAEAVARGRLPHESRAAWRPPIVWSHGVSVLVASSLYTGASSASYKDNSGTCLTSARASQGPGGSEAQAGVSSQWSPAPGPAARPCFCICTIPGHYLSSRRLRPGQAWETTARLQTSSRQRTGPGAVPGRPIASCSASVPPLPLLILHPEGTGVEQEGSNVLDGRVSRKLGRGMRVGNSVLKDTEILSWNVPVSLAHFIHIQKISSRATRGD